VRVYAPVPFASQKSALFGGAWGSAHAVQCLTLSSEASGFALANEIKIASS
jgi:hypothetical protein